MPRFEKGNRFSPGRRPGSRNREMAELDDAHGRDAGRLTGLLLGLAEDGNMRAAEMLLAPVWPRRRNRPVTLDLPPLDTPGELIQANAAVVAAMTRGEVTPAEAASIGRALEFQSRALQTHDNERIISELEAKGKAQAQRSVEEKAGHDPVATGSQSH